MLDRPFQSNHSIVSSSVPNTSMTVLHYYTYIAILPLDLHAMFFSLCADLRSADDQALAQVCSAERNVCTLYLIRTYVHTGHFDELMRTHSYAIMVAIC